MPNMNNKKRGATVDLILGDKELKKVPQGIDLYTCLEVHTCPSTHVFSSRVSVSPRFCT